MQVERQDFNGITKYKCTLRGCGSLRSFSGSVGKITENGIEEIEGLSLFYFILYQINIGSRENKQVSFLDIYHKGLENDGVQLMSLKFIN